MDARTSAAGRCDAGLGRTADSRAADRPFDSGAQHGRCGLAEGSSRCRDRRGAGVGDYARRGRDKYARSLRAAGGERPVGSSLLRAPGLPHGRSRRARGQRQSTPCFAAAARSRESHDGAARAVLRLARSLSRVSRPLPPAVHSACTSESLRRKCVFCAMAPAPWRDLLEQIGAWSPEWVPPACGPVDYLQRLGLLNDRLIAVHGVQFEDDELAAAGGMRCDRRDLSAQQPVDRRRRPADPSVLCVRRPRRDRHRQPGECAGSQSVHRDGGAAPAGTRCPCPPAF